MLINTPVCKWSTMQITKHYSLSLWNKTALVTMQNEYSGSVGRWLCVCVCKEYISYIWRITHTHTISWSLWDASTMSELCFLNHETTTILTWSTHNKDEEGKQIWSNRTLLFQRFLYTSDHKIQPVKHIHTLLHYCFVTVHWPLGTWVHSLCCSRSDYASH